MSERLEPDEVGLAATEAASAAQSNISTQLGEGRGVEGQAEVLLEDVRLQRPGVPSAQGDG